MIAALWHPSNALPSSSLRVGDWSVETRPFRISSEGTPAAEGVAYRAVPRAKDPRPGRFSASLGDGGYEVTLEPGVFLLGFGPTDKPRLSYLAGLSRVEFLPMPVDRTFPVRRIETSNGVRSTIASDASLPIGGTGARLIFEPILREDPLSYEESNKAGEFAAFRIRTSDPKTYEYFGGIAFGIPGGSGVTVQGFPAPKEASTMRFQADGRIMIRRERREVSVASAPRILRPPQVAPATYRTVLRATEEQARALGW